MGLDAVELVMAVEERFGIEIPDSEAAGISTPRMLIDYVSSKVGASDQTKCVSQRSFYRVRRILMAGGIERRAIGPQTHLDSLFPKAAWKTTWPKLGRTLGVRPRVRLSGPRGISIILVTMALAWTLLQLGQRETVVWLVSAGFAFASLIAFRATAVRLQTTVGEVALLAIPGLVSEDQLSARSTGWPQSEIAEGVRELIRTQLGIPEFADDATFRSLGLD